MAVESAQTKAPRWLALALKPAAKLKPPCAELNLPPGMVDSKPLAVLLEPPPMVDSGPIASLPSPPPTVPPPLAVLELPPLTAYDGATAAGLVVVVSTNGGTETAACVST